MTKMYTNKPLVEQPETEVQLAHERDHDHKRIKQLESKVSQLAEQVAKITEALQLNSRQIRRANTDINNLTTVIRNR